MKNQQIEEGDKDDTQQHLSEEQKKNENEQNILSDDFFNDLANDLL